jgi:dTDP-4-dehydrorhamnose reductase
MNSKKKILLISCTGQVGAELWRGLQPLGDVVPVDQHLTTVTRLDLTNPQQIREIIQQVKPNIIVNAAAYTAVDKAEQDQQVAMAINATAPQILADLAKQNNALLVHYSTDYVFDGIKRTPYLETDTPNPLNMYGKSKLAGDQAIQASGCNHLIFRNKLGVWALWSKFFTDNSKTCKRTRRITNCRRSNWITYLESVNCRYDRTSFITIIFPTI